MTEALISHIQRFSSDDGPGIRTTVFFKGCSLNCIWCHNPECLAQSIQLQFYERRCSNCGECVNICPSHAQELAGDVRSINRTKCRKCFQCVDACSTQALQRSGKFITVQDLVSEVVKDADYYQYSKGGVTLSGGEPLVQWEFCREFAQNLYRKNVRLAIDTAGFVPYENFAAVLPYVDLFLYDIKFYNSAKHKKYTGHPNVLIKENLEKLIRAGATITIRIPVIPGIHGDHELELISDYLYRNNIDAVELLPYHDLGVHKYGSLGIQYPLPNDLPMDEQTLANAVHLFKYRGIHAFVH
jgi:pyruvate formate lyase activating enzyme